jgi:hypothetical protein
MVLADRGTVVMDPFVLHLLFMVLLLRTILVWNNLSSAYSLRLLLTEVMELWWRRD